MWVCEENHKLIGFAIGIQYSNIIGRIVMVAIETKHQQKKIGSFLLTQLLREFSERNLTTIELEVKTTNQKAISFYKKNHFKIVELIPHFYQNGEDAYLMRSTVFPHTDD